MSISVKDSTGATIGLKSTTVATDQVPNNILYQTPATFGVSNEAVSSNNMTSLTPVTDLPFAGAYIVLVEMVISTDVDMQVEIRQETSGRLIQRLFLTGGVPFHFSPRSRVKLSVADKRVMAQTNTPGNICVGTYYFSEA